MIWGRSKKKLEGAVKLCPQILLVPKADIRSVHEMLVGVLAVDVAPLLLERPHFIVKIGVKCNVSTVKMQRLRHFVKSQKLF